MDKWTTISIRVRARINASLSESFARMDATV